MILPTQSVSLHFWGYVCVCICVHACTDTQYILKHNLVTIANLFQHSPTRRGCQQMLRVGAV